MTAICHLTAINEATLYTLQTCTRLVCGPNRKLRKQV